MSRAKGNWGATTRYAVVGVAALGLGAAAGAPARAADTNDQDLMAEIKALRAKVEQLEARQQDQQRKIERTDAAVVDNTVNAVLRDADRRSQLLAPEGFTAGYDNGKFPIQSADGKFVLNPNAQFQFRYVADFRQESKNGVKQSDDAQAGFEVRRLKFSLDGNLYGKDLTYKFQWATSRSTGNLQLDEGWVRYRFDGTPFAVRGGSFLNDFDHETGISSKRQIAVERTLLHEVIAGGGTGSENYVQGVQVIYDDGGALRASLAYHDGFNSRNTNFQDAGGGAPLLGINSPQGAAAGRVDYKMYGDWKQYDDFTALGNKDDLLVVGAGGDIELANNVTAYFHTVDVQWEPQAVAGLSVYAAYVGLLRDFRNTTTGSGDSPYDFGFVVQAGYLLNDQWEVFGRYDYTDLDTGAPTGAGTLGSAALVEDKLHEITVGVNYYLKGHAAKFTLDVSYLPNGSPINLDGAGILSQPTSEDQFVFRGQFQLLL